MKSAISFVKSAIEPFIRSRNIIKTYKNYSQLRSHGIGYDDQEIAEVVSRKTILVINKFHESIISRQLLQDIFIIREIEKLSDAKISIVDIGGACGYNFFVYNFFEGRVIKEYIIVETPSMVNVAKNTLTNDKLSFTSNLNDIESSCTLLILSGVIQYMPDISGLVDFIYRTIPDFIYITRTPLSINKDDSLFYLSASELHDHGPGSITNVSQKVIQTPTTLYSRRTLLGEFLKLGYTSLWHFNEDKNVLIEFDIGDILCENVGYLYSKRVINHV